MIDFDKIEWPLASSGSDWVKNLRPFSKNIHCLLLNKIENVKILECNLRLLELTDFDERHLHELDLMSNY